MQEIYHENSSIPLKRLLIPCIMVLGAVLAMYGISYIEVGDWNSLYLKIPLNMMVNKMKPEFYKHPSLYFDIVAVLFKLSYVILRSTSQVKDMVDFFVKVYFQPLPFHLLSKMVSLLSFVGLIGILALVGRRLYNQRVGLLTAFLAACSPALLEQAQREMVDMLAAFLIVLLFAQVIKTIEKTNLVNFILIGFLLGLGISTNYPAALSGIFLLWIHFHFLRSGVGGFRSWRFLLTALVAACFAFAITSPYMLLDYKSFLNDFFFQARSITEASEARELIGLDPLFYFRYFFSNGGIILLASIPGIIWLTLKGNTTDRMAICFMVVFTVFFHITKTKEARWGTPVIPFLCLFAAWTLDNIAQRLRMYNKWSDTFITVLVIIVCFYSTISLYIIPHWNKFRHGDPRLQASIWLKEHVNKGSIVLFERSTVLFNSVEEKINNFQGLGHGGPKENNFAYYSFSAFKRASNNKAYRLAFYPYSLTPSGTMGDDTYYKASFVKALNATWIVTDSDYVQQYQKLYEYKPERYQKIMDFYKWLDENYKLVKIFTGKFEDRTRTISIYHRTKPFPDRLKYQTMYQDQINNNFSIYNLKEELRY